MSDLKFWTWSLFHNFEWDHGATLLAGGIAAFAVLIGFVFNSANSRRQRRAQIYADSLKAVSDYLEGPYRVARCHNSDDQRFALATDISAIQGRIDAQGLLLALHSPNRVAQAFDDYVAAARLEAGRQMAEQWKKPARRHRDMNIQPPFSQPRSVRAKQSLVVAMERDMAPRWFNPWSWLRG